MLKYCAGSGLDHTFVYPVQQCERGRQTPPLSEHSNKIPVYNVSPDKTTAVLSLKTPVLCLLRLCLCCLH